MDKKSSIYKGLTRAFKSGYRNRDFTRGQDRVSFTGDNDQGARSRRPQAVRSSSESGLLGRFAGRVRTGLPERRFDGRWSHQH
jgi:hypothetical protein